MSGEGGVYEKTRLIHTHSRWIVRKKGEDDVNPAAHGTGVS